MTRHAIALSALLSSLAWLPAQSARAQNADFPMGPQFAVKLMLGLGGEVETEVDGTNFQVQDDLDATWGLGAHFLYPVIKWFAIGGQIAVQSWKPDTANDSNVLLDFALLPAGLLPVARNVQLYASVPLGISLDFWGYDPPVGDIGTGFGFTIGFMLGAQFALSDSVGLLVELGYVAHSWGHDADAQAGPVTVNGDFDASIGQFALNLGAYF